MKNKEITHGNFNIPLRFQKNTPIEQNLINDLELINTQEKTNIPVVDYLFKPTNELGKKSLNQWNCYTSDVNFLKESQKLYNNIDDLQEKRDVIDDMLKTWKNIKGIQKFDERFQYIEWERLAFLNSYAIFMYFLSFLNITAPIMQLIAPLMAFILPFFLLKAAGIPVSMDKYTEILKKIMSTNALYKLVTSFNEVDAKQKVTMLVTVGLYFYNLYQNLLSCYKFYSNSFFIIEKLNSIKEYLNYTINQITLFENKIKPYHT